MIQEDDPKALRGHGARLAAASLPPHCNHPPCGRPRPTWPGYDPVQSSLSNPAGRARRDGCGITAIEKAGREACTRVERARPQDAARGDASSKDLLGRGPFGRRRRRLVDVGYLTQRYRAPQPMGTTPIHTNRSMMKGVDAAIKEEASDRRRGRMRGRAGGKACHAPRGEPGRRRPYAGSSCCSSNQASGVSGDFE